MTPEQLGRAAADSVLGVVEACLGGQAPLSPIARDLDALAEAFAALARPVCAEKGCRNSTLEGDALSRCAACGRLFCDTHLKFGTTTTGEPSNLCVDCQPGPDPQEF